MRSKLAATFAMFLAVLCLFGSVSQAAVDNRRALLVMDADTGKILRQENAYAKRYPASLTKMMTLYLLFDALRKGEVKMGSSFTASRYAASQPQTNISLRPGDKITVEDAIKALVVRSANDVAVVVAEGLGRSTWNFGVMMTRKARELGMKNTIFRNPNGLPDNAQYTTAYDLALLGVALRRDFPQYYGNFTANIFRYHGRTYTGHNRVIGRFDGVDGIKTGFINASGFNLVTSVKREGFNIVAVIMGGTSGASRDNEMVSLLQRTFAALQSQKDHPRMLASAPTPVANPKRAMMEKGGAVADAVSSAVIKLGLATPEEPKAAPAAPRFSFHFGHNKNRRTGYRPAEAEEAVEPIEAEKPIEVAPVARVEPIAPTPPTPPVVAAKPMPRKGTLEYQQAMIDAGQGDVSYDAPRSSLALGAGNDWGIQVGAFAREDQAKEAVQRAFGLLKGELGDAYITITKEGNAAKPIHRARIGNLSQTEAQSACRKLAASQQSCFSLRME